MKTIAILTSGGDSPGMNAAIRAVARTALDGGLKVIGVNRGYSGLINGELFPMNRDDVSDIIQRGGTILKTARCEEFRTAEGREKAVEVLRAFNVDGLVVIGGNGSFMGAQLLSKLGIYTVGLPGTIDNDLSYTDYTIGFDTAQNTVIDAIDKIRDTSSSHERVSIVEVMGRDCGDIALFAGIAGGAEKVLLPERVFNLQELCKSIGKSRIRGKMHSLIVVAEGVVADNISGSDDLANKIQQATGIETRATKLGHVQRGGSPTAFDRILATKMGYRAVQLLIEGKSSRVVGIKDNKIIDLDIDEALAIPRGFDEELYQISKTISR